MSVKNTKGYWFACVDGNVVVDPALSPFDKAVFAVLCFHADSDDRECYLKVATIAREAGCSERSVQRSLKKLEGLGIIECKNRFENNRQLSSVYRIIGDKAPCYATQGEAPETRGVCETPGGCPTGTQNESHLNYKDSLTGEAPLPDLSDVPLVFENGQPVTQESSKPQNPEETHTPDEAPDVMKSTADLLLLKTGRTGLSWEEISALRTLSATQYPARVQKEIDRAITRFNRKGRPLHTLTFMYIAGSLEHQPSLAKKRKAKPTPAQTPEHSNDNADAEMAEIEAMLAKFDKEAQGK